jgi:hypothetical protein
VRTDAPVDRLLRLFGRPVDQDADDPPRDADADQLARIQAGAASTMELPAEMF